MPTDFVPPSIGLCGFMGTGKSHVGRLLAQQLGRPFADSDELVASRFGKSIAQVFSDEGEEAFRSVEGAVCRELAAESGRVVALGGGSILNPATLATWLRHGILVRLHASSATILKRLAAAQDRPLLTSTDDPARRVAELLALRDPVYRWVPNQVDSDRPLDEVVCAVAAIVQQEEEVWRSCGVDGQHLVLRSPEGSYPIWIGATAITAIGPLLSTLRFEPGPVVVVTHPELRHLCDVVRRSLTDRGHVVTVLDLPSGEGTKRLTTVEHIHTTCIAARLTRDRPLIALGGGVIGDVTGFAAATFLRGVPWIQMPTTLLAMVDASVGGKTGVDRPEGKNLVGAFHHPRAVVVDVGALATLPRAELRAGMGEVVKHALLVGGELLDDLEAGRLKLDAAGIARVIEVKAQVVEEDPMERGRRVTLNLGHTFAHAIEQVSNYTIRHGDAVAVGLRAAAHLSADLQLAPATLAQRVERLLEGLGLLQHVSDLDEAALIAAMAVDKKHTTGRQRFVLLRDVGDAVVVSDVAIAAIRRAWRAVLR